MLRASMLKLKATYPELAGVIMYGHPPNKGFPNATNASTAASDAATVALIRAASQLMLELYPDPKPDQEDIHMTVASARGIVTGKPDQEPRAAVKTDEGGLAVSFGTPTLLGSNRPLKYYNSTAFPHFFFPSISVATGRGANVAQHITMADDGPVCPPPNEPDMECSETMITRDGGKSYSLAATNDKDTSGNFNALGDLGQARAQPAKRSELACFEPNAKYDRVARCCRLATALRPHRATSRLSQATMAGTGWTASPRRSCSTGETAAPP